MYTFTIHTKFAFYKYPLCLQDAGPFLHHYFVVLPLWYVGVFSLGIHIKGKSTLVLMYSGIVNGYQLLCDGYTVTEQHRGTAALFLFYSVSSFSAFSFCVFVILTVPFLSWVPL